MSSKAYGKNGGNVVSLEPGTLVTIDTDGYGHEVTLSSDDQVSLALDLLADSHDIHEEADGSVTLTRKRKRAEVGQFYRVKSAGSMMKPWQNNPIARVVKVDDGRGLGQRIILETSEKHQCGWSNLDLLEGPLDVVEVTVKTEWRERAEVEG